MRHTRLVTISDADMFLPRLVVVAGVALWLLYVVAVASYLGR